MKKYLFNQEWMFSKKKPKSLVEAMSAPGEPDERVKVTLPYDAMIREEVTPETKNGGQTGYYPGGIYYYSKEFEVPEEWQGNKVILEFEGIAGKARITVNGCFAGHQVYAYTGTYIDLSDLLRYGASNRIEVEVNNTMEQDSRWYTGSGIYRDVNLYVGGIVHIPVYGVAVSTPEVGEDVSVVLVNAEIENRDVLSHSVRVTTEIISNGKICAERETPVTLWSQDKETVEQRITLENPRLWSCDDPSLYQCHVVVRENGSVLDETWDEFGIRELRLDPVKGLRINGEEVKLRGSCIHHDHGVIGASSFEAAEERKIRLLKEAGFNCIRMSHHPAGKALLRACDKAGVLVMDELFDMWTCPKNLNDFSGKFAEHWETITEDMIRKDYNHPSVILYSTGNEIQEAGTRYGAKINRMICRKIKSMDTGRYVTSALNGIIASGDQFGRIVGEVMAKLKIPMPDMSAGEAADGTKGTSEAGSDALNAALSIMVGPMADEIARHPLLSELTEEYVEAGDIAGYNYLTGRHEAEHASYPERVVLGTETFPADIANLWQCVKNNSHVIGDMTWTGYDYLGEAGVGIFHYGDGMNFNAVFPERLAYIGDIDITGNRRPISYLREIVYGLRKAPYIGVERPDRYGQETGRTAWMWKDNIASWTWPGSEGKRIRADVICDAEEVELFVNGVSAGRKRAGEASGFTAVYELVYEPGEIRAVAIREGCYAEEFSLHTAGAVVRLKAEADKYVLKKGGDDLSFINITLTDAEGRENLYDEKKVSVKVTGNALLEGLGSARPSCRESYSEPSCRTYDGRLLAVIRSGMDTGTASVSIQTEGCPEEIIEFTIE